ncbi:MAG TPA: glycosyltransferase [Geobacteraceae bacterium]|nr:glycosyltransferase [Geobacteraceae bacterium]
MENQDLFQFNYGGLSGMPVPKISVCIPTYNYARYLPETIESVLEQSFADFELIIIDDCSSDDTAVVVGRYVERDRRIRFSVNAKNLGMVENWNLCLTRAKGEFIKYVFGDDLLSSRDALKKMVSVLETDSSISLVASSRDFIDTRSRKLKSESRFRRNAVFSGTAVINRCLKEQKNLIGEPTVVMFRKRDAARGFLPHYWQIVDQEMWFYLLEQGNLAFLTEPLISFRIHPEQQTSKNVDTLNNVEDIFHLYDDYMDRPYISIAGLRKSYIRYDNIYEIWKLYAKGFISWQTATLRIGKHLSIVLFVLMIPLYHIMRCCFKAVNAIGRILGRV